RCSPSQSRGIADRAFAGDYNAGTTYLDENRRSGQLKHVRESGAAHREAVPLEGGRTNQNFVQYQRTRGNCRGGDKKGFPIVVVTVVDIEQGTTEIINV